MNKMWRRAEIWDPKVVAIDTFDEPILGLSGLKLKNLSCLRYVRHAEPGEGKDFFDIFISADQQDPASEQVANEPIVTTPRHDLVMATVKKLLARCLSESSSKEHKQCSQKDLPLLPTRVISIDENPQYIRLYESIQHQRAQYIALSYVWGMQTQPIITTAATLSKHINGIQVSTLPQTVQDAIVTATKLGIQYLWVDVLCIIQDKGHPDKAQELKNMGEYYKNATLTIAAAAATKVTQGFLHPREPSPACELPLYIPHRPQGKITATAKVTSEQALEPLYSRAWALEEFLLSARLLIFGTREAIWQCNFSDPQPVLPSNIDYDPSWPCRRFANKERRRTIWSAVVKDYTARDMTYLSDRLPAIDGLARVLEVKWQDTYLYGLWYSRLHVELMWGSDCKTLPDPAKLRAPSWSWAAVDGKVKIPPIFSERKDAEIKWVDDHNGGVKGQLCLHAAVKSLKDLRPLIEKRRAEPENEPGKPTNSGVHDDVQVLDDESIKFILLGFHSLGAFGLLVRPVASDSKLYMRVGMLKRFLGDSSWWEHTIHLKENITVI
ncbi:hypothetical protein ACLOAV_009089 [Pseudogymnoascus australis]